MIKEYEISHRDVDDPKKLLGLLFVNNIGRGCSGRNNTFNIKAAAIPDKILEVTYVRLEIHVVNKKQCEIFGRKSASTEKEAIAEAFKQLALLKSGCMIYEDDLSLSALPEKPILGQEDREQDEYRRAQVFINQFKSGVIKFSTMINASIEKRAGHLLGLRIYSFGKIVAEVAARTYNNKYELLPADIKNIIAKYLEKNALKAANSEGNKCLLLYENGLLDFSAKRKIKYGWSKGNVIREDIFASVFKPSIKTLLKEINPNSTIDSKAPQFLGHILTDVALYLAQSSSEMCKMKKTNEMGSEDLNQSVRLTFPEQLKQHALLKASDDVGQYHKGFLVYDREPDRPKVSRIKRRSKRKSPKEKERIPAEAKKPEPKKRISSKTKKPLPKKEISAESKEPLSKKKIPAKSIKPLPKKEIPAESKEPLPKKKIPAKSKKPILKKKIIAKSKSLPKKKIPAKSKSLPKKKVSTKSKKTEPKKKTKHFIPIYKGRGTKVRKTSIDRSQAKVSATTSSKKTSKTRTPQKNSKPKEKKTKKPFNDATFSKEIPTTVRLNFAPAISDILPAVFKNERMSLTKESKNNLCNILEDACDALVSVSISVADSAELSIKEIKTAVDKLFPKQIGDLAIAFGLNVVQAWEDNQNEVSIE
ncbi:hypothetical protein HNY73_016254 [Argiope bruennichi]|uniref:Uncharacterized protein n=1 Tax=Argiope bruennichi TaxID=94029 RepID=A0A8T0EJ63_ARGBR|nr:hypothetical protein HNY73_016254 [Argiope bruennichi]